MSPVLKIVLASELKKLAIQVADIARNVSKFELDESQGYPPEIDKVLLRMQRRAFETVLLATTTLL